MDLRERIGQIGVWSSAWSNAYRAGNTELYPALADAAAELDALGYGALWLGTSPSVAYAARALDATTRIVVATGVLNIWGHDAADVASQRDELDRRHPGRFVLGLGVSHSHSNPQYTHPYQAMQDYLSALDAAATPAPRQSRILAALGPKMLALSRDRAAGAHPYLVTVEQTAMAREILGADSLLAPDLKVVLDSDVRRARTTARGFLARYLQMRNYIANFERAGFAGDDFRDGGSDRLIDAVFALGDTDVIAARVNDFLAAGADHLAVQVVTDTGPLPLAEWRRLAEVLKLSPPRS